MLVIIECCLKTCLIWILFVCELYGGVMATIKQETVKLNKVSLGSNLVIFFFVLSLMQDWNDSNLFSQSFDIAVMFYLYLELQIFK
jgi:hypothetical protein